MATESSFTWKGATIRVKDLTIGEEEEVSKLFLRLPEEEHEGKTATAWTFCQFQIAAEIDGEGPLPRVTDASSQREIMEALAAWRALPARLQSKWRQAFTEAEGDADPK